MMHRRELIASGAAALGAGWTASALAQAAWPRHPVTIVVPFDAAGSADRLARGFAQFMPKHLGQPMVVVDRAGASGMIGTNWLLQQPADGYTVMLSPATPFIPINILVAGARYKLDDFTFVNAQWTDYTALVVQKDRPWKTAAELIDAIKANPGKITTGVDFGSVGHISTLALLKALGLPPTAIRFVTFDGSGAMHTALAGGQIDFYISQAEAALVIKDFVRVLAVFTEHRMPEYDAPPINEVLKAYHAQVPLLDGSVRTFVFPAAFKAKHPQDYAKFVAAYRATLDDPAFQKWLADNRMAGEWVGEARTQQIIRADFDQLKAYKDLLKK
jgi:tripartite-type tricarboxylate transporter receptor subunit TctC